MPEYPRLGAVSYLNMLPYFFDTPDITLSNTPKELNGWVLQGKLHGGCMSAIVGLQNHLIPLTPLFGVGSRHMVGSVFLEPLDSTQTNPNGFWSQWEKHLPSSLYNPMPPTQTKTILFTQGASQQSLWMSQVLLQRFGCQVIIKTLPSGAERWTSQHIKQWWDTEKEFPYIEGAILTIGDKALWLAQNRPAFRYDLGDLWMRFSGLPPIFAIWFCHPQFAPQAHKSVASAVERWANLTAHQQLNAIQKYDPNTNAKHLEYLNNLSYELNGDFKKTHLLYKELMDDTSFKGGPSLTAS